MNNEELQKLKTLAQAATPGRWIRLFGERTVYDVMEDGCRGIAIVRADSSPPMPQEAANLDFIAAANPAIILELIAIAEKSLAAPTVAGAVLNDEQICKMAVEAGFISHGDGFLVLKYRDHYTLSCTAQILKLANAILASAAPLYAAAQAPSQADSRDAARYRALRDDSYQMHEDDISVSDSSFMVYFGAGLDDAVDALIKRKEAIDAISTTGDAAIGEKGNG